MFDLTILALRPFRLVLRSIIHLTLTLSRIYCFSEDNTNNLDLLLPRLLTNTSIPLVQHGSVLSSSPKSFSLYLRSAIIIGFYSLFSRLLNFFANNKNTLEYSLTPCHMLLSYVRYFSIFGADIQKGECLLRWKLRKGTVTYC